MITQLTEQLSRPNTILEHEWLFENVFAEIRPDDLQRLKNGRILERVDGLGLPAYIAGRGEIHLHLSRPGFKYPKYCAVIQRPCSLIEGKLYTASGFDVSQIEFDRLNGAKMQESMLVDVVKVVEQTQGMSWRCVPSTVRLKRFDMCNEGGDGLFELVNSEVTVEASLARMDRKLTPSPRCIPTIEDSVVCELIEARTPVVKNFSEHNGKAQRWFDEVADVKRFLSTCRFILGNGNIKRIVQVPNEITLQVAQLHFRSC